MSQGNSSSDMMMLNLFNNVPSDVAIDILSRLTAREITFCKCVCKTWLRLVETREFVKAHLSKSAQGLIVYQSDMGLNLYKVLDLEDRVDVEDHDLHYNLVSTFDLPFSGWLYGSADGLLFLCELTPIDTKPDDLHICNPITREYVKLDSPEEFVYDNQVVTYGFGSSSTTSQYKVVRISHDRVFNQETEKWQVTSQAECHVYTLGSGSWRRCASSGWLEYLDHVNGVFSNGIIHWVIRDSNGGVKISCFNLETESFSTISTPFRNEGRSMNYAGVTLFAFEGSLGLCDNTLPGVVFIWLMREYGVESSWKMQFIMSKSVEDFGNGESASAVFYLVKLFKDGDMLLAWKDFFLVYYSSRTASVQEVDMFRVPPDNMLDAILYTPSFLSLASFGFEDVTSF